MTQLQWLVGKRYRHVAHRDYDWVFEFDDETSITGSCLWRLVIDGKIRLTSQDSGHKFGLQSPVDAANELDSQLGNRRIIAIDLKNGTLDLAICFDDKRTLEMIPDSSGYEAWVVNSSQSQFIAVGGGDLAVVPNAPKS